MNQFNLFEGCVKFLTKLSNSYCRGGSLCPLNATRVFGVDSKETPPKTDNQQPLKIKQRRLHLFMTELTRIW